MRIEIPGGGAAMSRTEALPTLRSSRIEAASLQTAPLLIQVPFTRHGRRPRDLGQHRVHRRQPRLAGGRQPKRRLRREVRMTGFAILALSCVTATWNHWRSPGKQLWFAPTSLSTLAHPARPGSAAGTDLAETSQTATHLLPILLSIEPVGTSAEADVEAPVVFPGYLLPDDNREEPAHGGS
jgi:hypothetical protein